MIFRNCIIRFMHLSGKFSTFAKSFIRHSTFARLILYPTLIVLLGFSSPIIADTCQPDESSTFRVSGVRSDDSLNVRSGPTTKYPVVTELFPDESGVRYGGSSYYLEWECQALCRDVNRGETQLITQVQEQCFEKNLVWFEIITQRGISGWVSAKYLTTENDTEIKQDNQPVEDQAPIIAEETPESDKNLRDFLIANLFLDLCNEGGYISGPNKIRISQKYRQYVAEHLATNEQISGIEAEIKRHDAYQIWLLGLVSQNGNYDPYWQEQCNGIAAAILIM